MQCLTGTATPLSSIAALLKHACCLERFSRVDGYNPHALIIVQFMPTSQLLLLHPHETENIEEAKSRRIMGGISGGSDTEGLGLNFAEYDPNDKTDVNYGAMMAGLGVLGGSSLHGRLEAWDIGGVWQGKEYPAKKRVFSG